MTIAWKQCSWLAACVGFLLPGASNLLAQDLAVVNAHLPGVERDQLRGPVTIVISNGRIASIGPSDTAPDSATTRIDVDGLVAVPGRVEDMQFTPEFTNRRLREEMLVRLGRGTTTLTVPEGTVSQVRSMLPRDYPAPHLVPRSVVAGDHVDASPAAGLEIGAHARFLLVESPPWFGADTPARPMAAVVGSQLYLREQLELEARALAEELRRWLYEDLPFEDFARRGAPFPRECLADSNERCLGPDPGCALMHGLLLIANTGIECRSELAGELRRRFLASLARLSAVAPADAWIVGQRVHFGLIERDFDQATAAVEECAAEAWWCDALRGLVHHAGAPGAGGTYFDAALSSVPRAAPAWRDPPFPDAGDRGAFCEWRDITYLIEGPATRQGYGARPCGDRSDFEEGFWWLADPLWSVPGNPRRDEHIARNVRAKFRDQYLRIYGGSGRWLHGHCDVSLADWGRDSSPSQEVRCRSSHADWVRFGAPDSWRGIQHARGPGFIIGADGKLVARNGESCQTMERRRVCTRNTYGQLREGFLAGGYSFVPAGVALVTPEASPASDWEVNLGEGHERMVTAETWYNLDQQTAVLRRGDSLQVLSAGAFPTLLPSLDELDATLALGRVGDREVLLEPAEVDRVTGVVRAEAMIEDTDWVVSLEASAPGVRGRTRQGAIAPVLVDGFGISKPVVVDAEFDPDEGDLLQAMVPSNTLPGSGATGLYIELYGVEAGQQVRMTLSYELGEVRRSFFGRIASALGIGEGPSGPVTVEWTEQLETVREGVGSIFVTADLGDLPTGEVELSLSASLEGQSASSSTTVQSR